MRRIAFSLVAFLFVFNGLAASEGSLSELQLTTGFEAPQLLATIKDKRLPESSGLVCGRVHRDVFWTVNDSGNMPIVHAIDVAGKYRGSFYLPKVGNVDWEALTACTIDNVSYLVIADIGDNFAVRPSYKLYFVKEPRVINNELIDGSLTPIPASYVLEFVYPDGARDCEAIAIDEEAGLIYLLSKRDLPVRLYSLPLPDIAAATMLQTATFIHEVHSIPRPTTDDVRNDKAHGKNKSHITDMAFDVPRGIIVLNTYKHMYVFQRVDGQSWSEAFLNQPTFIKRPKLRQPEGLCFDEHGNIYFNSEQNPWPLYQMKRITETGD